MAQKDLKSRIASVKNIQKITRAMEMVAAARLRRAEQRIEHLRPYAGAIRRMTRQAAAAAENIPSLPILQEHEQVRQRRPAVRDRRPRARGRVQLADPARRLRAANEHERRGPRGRLLRVGQARRLVAHLPRARPRRQLRRLHRPPRLRERARDRRGPDGRIRRRRPRPGRDLLQRLRLPAHAGGAPRDAAAAAAGHDPARRRRTRTRTTRATTRSSSTSPTRSRSCTG